MFQYVKEVLKKEVDEQTVLKTETEKETKEIDEILDDIEYYTDLKDNYRLAKIIFALCIIFGSINFIYGSWAMIYLTKKVSSLVAFLVSFVCWRNHKTNVKLMDEIKEKIKQFKRNGIEIYEKEEDALITKRLKLVKEKQEHRACIDDMNKALEYIDFFQREEEKLSYHVSSDIALEYFEFVEKAKEEAMFVADSKEEYETLCQTNGLDIEEEKKLLRDKIKKLMMTK